MPKIAIFTLTKDRLAYTQKMFASLWEHSRQDIDHFVIDNGSTDGTQAYLQDLRRRNLIAGVVENPHNRGIPVASNQALDLIARHENRYDLIIKVDNDCEIMTPDWLGPIIEIISDFKRQIVLSPTISGIVGSHKEGGLTYDRQVSSGWTIGLARHLGGICIVAPAEIYDTFRFPETGFLHGGNDINFSYHVRKRGYLMGYVEGIMADHIDTSGGQVQKFPEYFKKRLNLEKRIAYGEHRRIAKLKYPWRRLVRIHKLHYLGLSERGIFAHVAHKTKNTIGNTVRSLR